MSDEYKEQPILNEDDYTLIYTCQQAYEAEMVKANLESGGIDAFILSQSDSSIVSLGDFSIIKIFVRNEHAEAALEYIEAINPEDSDSDTDDEISEH